MLREAWLGWGRRFRELLVACAKKKAAGGGAGRRGHGVMEVQLISRSDSRRGSTPNLERKGIVREGGERRR